MKKIKEFSVFFNNEEEFNKITGYTSYYSTMQNSVAGIIKGFSPSYVLEFGAGSGNTSFRIAKENPQLSLVAVDNREELVTFCQNKKEFKAVSNLTFITGDLINLNSFNFINVDIVYMVYSFNYINDPLETKEMFIKNIYNKMKKGARLIIGDWFLPNVPRVTQQVLKDLYNSRIKEGAQSIFWNVLNGKQNEEDIENAHKMLEEYKTHHKKLLKNLLKRESLFPVSREWLVQTAEKAGFTVEFNELLNNINDAVFVLTK